MMLLNTLFICIKSIETTTEVGSTSLTDIKEYTNDDINNICKEYGEYLDNKLGSLEQAYIDRYFIKDIDFKDLSEDQEKRILVWDLGGTYFKLSYVKITVRNKHIYAENFKIKEISYPSAEDSKDIYWEDWAAKCMAEYVLEHGILPDASSLIVSYPLCYQDGDVFIESFTKFFAFKQTNNRKIMAAIRESIKNVLSSKSEEFKNEFNEKDLEERLSVKTVVNDSVASYFASKMRNYEFNISIIMGTGTNAAFSIKHNGEKYVYNSEWASFKPTSISFLQSELNLYNEMCEKHVNVNFLDVVAANGCKFDLINSLLPPDVEPITKKNFKAVLENEDDIRKKIHDILMKRSKQLISGLTLAAIRHSCQDECCLIVTNGSGFDNKKDSEVFESTLTQYIPLITDGVENFRFEFLNEKGLTLSGSALLTFHRIIN